jgi:hypothetical protein
VADLNEIGLADINEQGITPHDWHERQFQSDVSTDRVKAFRERSVKRDETFHETVNVTPTESEADTEAESERKKDQPSLRSGLSAEGADDGQKALILSEPELPKSLDRRPEHAAFEAYNEIASRVGWPVAQKLTQTRLARLRARLADCGGVDAWRAAMERAAVSPFLRGETGRSDAHEKWTPDLDFFLKEATFTRLMEGKYDDRNSSEAAQGFARTVAAAEDVLDVRRRRRASENGSGQPRPGGDVGLTETPARLSLAEGGEGGTEREAGHLPDRS